MKQTYWIGGILAILLLAGCRPKDVLSPSKMEQALYKLHRTDQIVQVAGLTAGNNPEMDNYYLCTLEELGITQAEFDSSLVWYTDHPQQFDKIYPRVFAKLQREAAMWNSLYQAELHCSAR